MNLICFTHSDYLGTTNPVLSCKTCCHIYLGSLKESQAERDDAKKDQRQWMLDKVSEARRALVKDPGKSANQPK